MDMNYWKEATRLADALLPIPPRVCIGKDGKVIKDDRCLKCPMKVQCELKTEQE